MPEISFTGAAPAGCTLYSDPLGVQYIYTLRDALTSAQVFLAAVTRKAPLVETAVRSASCGDRQCINDGICRRRTWFFVGAYPKSNTCLTSPSRVVCTYLPEAFCHLCLSWLIAIAFLPTPHSFCLFLLLLGN
ncbi:hypothetical protein L228DRAFT_120022 [Xylona heveae TC161]|uniref:Uncharacterized protein n=1 Tax=Xylona heveae (strain CBS 132557 / TC161) TaxID=1328760 RepID=A0A165HIM5_XYLHT|nr:hypothetical protein L228DRAFT_120022 [Xylona heveae TC161]KZF23574.1 hypothetical protein L228DRAFT_120022 [Xylona heveae TC161]